MAARTAAAIGLVALSAAAAASASAGRSVPAPRGGLFQPLRPTSSPLFPGDVRRTLRSFHVHASASSPSSHSPTSQVRDQQWPLWPALPIFPFNNRKTVLTEVVQDQVWTLDQLQGTLYVHVPVRMTVVRIRDRESGEGSLLAYSPIAPTRECIRMVRTLEERWGPLRHIILPTLGVEHKVFAGPMARTFREAQLWLLPDQYSFPVDLPLAWVGFAGARPKPLPPTSEGTPWEGQLDHTVIGTFKSRDGAFAEAAFLHRATGTLLVVDTIVCVRPQQPDIMNSDVDALLFHARDTGFEVVTDTPAVRRRGWQRIALFALYFNPAGIRVKSIGESLRDSAMTPVEMKRLGWFGLYPWDWDPAVAVSSFNAIRDRPLVPPVLRELILDRQPEASVEFARRVASWRFKRIIPAHLNAPIRANSAKWLRAWSFLLDRTIDVDALLPARFRPAEPTPGDLRLLKEVSDTLVETKVTAPPGNKVKKLI